MNKVILFYKYYWFQSEEVLMLVEDCRSFCDNHGILGRLLLSTEGVNGSLAGSLEAISLFITFFESIVDIGPIDWKYSLDDGDTLPFLALSVRYMKELIAPGNERAFINQQIEYDKSCFGGLKGTGKHLSPAEFHTGIQQADSLVVDIRNEFEYNIGHFTASKNLETFTYAETWKSLDNLLENVDREDGDNGDDVKHKPIYMYCTGGIRCEKASAYLIGKGYDNVHQLQGGIHRYLEVFPDGGLFQGKNFVFDSRVSMPSAQQPSDKQQVIGSCIDCAEPYDRFSGHVVCTVCRIPILVCTSCIEHNPYPEEYYCSRHRFFKDIYFTVLERFSDEALLMQISHLKGLFQSFHRTNDRHRRRTITRQITKIKELLRCRELEKSTGKESSLSEQVVSPTSVDIPLPSQAEEYHNPQARGGWGFWRD